MFDTCIVLVTYNQVDFTKQCIHSIFHVRTKKNFELIIVDNNSSDETVAFLKEFGKTKNNLKIILNNKNLGFAEACNIGASQSSSDIIIFLNNDTVVTDFWLDNLLPHLEDINIGLVGALTNSSGNKTKIKVDYDTDTLEGLTSFAEKIMKENEGKYFEIDMLPFQIVGIKQAVFEKVGNLDNRFSLGMFEDDDYALRIKHAGLKIICAEDVFIHHWGSASFSKLDFATYWELFETNLNKFEKKWGIKWYPPLTRIEFVQQQFRDFIDANLYFSKLIVNLEKELIEVKKQQIKITQNVIENNHQSIFKKIIQKIINKIRKIFPESSLFFRLLRRGKRFFNSIIIKLVNYDRYFFNKKNIHYLHNPVIKENERSPEEISVYIPLISVVLPVYNHSDMVNETIESVLNCTYPRIELIIIDDGSTDGIEENLNKYSVNPRVKIYRQKNQKLPRALTNGHAYANGEFITWTSADNLFLPDAFDKLAFGLINNPDAIMVYADVAVIDENGFLLKDCSYRRQNIFSDFPEIIRLHQDSISLGYEKDNFINACFLYREDFAKFLNFHYSDDLRGLEDYDFWLRLQKMGKILHIKNEEPLYLYRVHTRSMSHELLTKEMEAHLLRGDKLIDFESRRRDFCDAPWNINTSEGIPICFLQYPQNYNGEFSFIEKEAIEFRKILTLGQWNTEYKLCLSLVSDFWIIQWKNELDDGNIQKEEKWKGYQISPLALKARDLSPLYWDFPNKNNRKIILSHIDQEIEKKINIKKLMEIIKINTDLYFVFLSTSEFFLLNEIKNIFDNVVLLSNRNFGEDYNSYACCNGVWLPPLTNNDYGAYKKIKLLSLNIIKPLYIFETYTLDTTPYQYLIKEDGYIYLSNTPMNRHVCDLYIESYLPKEVLNKVIKIINGITQEAAIQRPDFGKESHDKSFSSPKKFKKLKTTYPLNILIVVDHLDRGGLEEVIYQLATNLSKRNVNVYCLCFKSGGLIAHRLKSQGFNILIANENLSLVKKYILKNKINIVSSHLVNVDVLKCIYDLGIPICETIHNTYIWFNREYWHTEIKRSRYFSKAIAVSNLVKTYYALKNRLLPEDSIEVIPNGIDNERLNRCESFNYLENKINNEFTYLCVASYDGRKNQRGIIFAFDELFKKYNKIKLVFVGNIVDKGYFDSLHQNTALLKSRNNISFEMFSDHIMDYYQSADVFVLNSFFEGWSMAASEALMTGLPLIHSNSGSGKELIGEMNQRGYLISNPGGKLFGLKWDNISEMFDKDEYHNSEELTRAMEQVYVDRLFWANKRDEIQDWAQNVLSIDVMIKRYLNIFKELQ